MEKKPIVYDDGEIATILINRPEKLNAMNREVLEGIDNSLLKVDMDDEVRVVIIRGAGDRAFSSGLDLKIFTEDDKIAQEILIKINKFIRKDLTTPSIAAVEGYALAGGFSLSCACDFTIASEGSRFGIPEVKSGIVPGVAMQWATRLVGRKRAYELVMTGEMIDAEKAKRWGLVNKVVKPEKFDEVVKGFATTLSEKNTITLGGCKKGMAHGLEMNFSDAIDYGMTRAELALTSPEVKKEVEAFFEED